MPYLAWLRHIRGDFSPDEPGSRFSSGIEQSSNMSCEVIEARRDTLCLISGALKPVLPASTRKPRTSSSTFAHTTATSAMLPFVIHDFAPFNTHRFPLRTARVIIPPGSEPWSGSVSPKQPILSPRASFENNWLFCCQDTKGKNR